MALELKQITKLKGESPLSFAKVISAPRLTFEKVKS